MARIPDSIKMKFRNMLEESKGHERFKKMLATGNDDNFKWAYEISLEYGHGKAPQSLDVEVNDVTGRPSQEQLDAALRSTEYYSGRNGMAKK